MKKRIYTDDGYYNELDKQMAIKTGIPIELTYEPPLEQPYVPREKPPRDDELRGKKYRRR